MKVLITGCKGQVGRELVFLAKSYGCETIALDRQAFDITDQLAVAGVIQHYKPDAVINAAAYTDVDKAESDVEMAYAINATAVAYLAQSCANLDVPLVHISTDYVFDGNKLGAYKEDDVVNPLNVYGKSKLAGEEAIRNVCEKYYILRTSWVFSEHGNNFFKTMLRLGCEREELSIVNDQYGKPTFAREVAKAVYVMLNSQKKTWGVYHVSQPDMTSWYEFGKEIFTQAREKGVELKISTLHGVSAADYSAATKRPLNSELDCVKFEKIFDFCLTPWQESLQNDLDIGAVAKCIR